MAIRPTNQPVRFIGRQRYARTPLARLDDVRAAVRLGTERDLRRAPTPISGGMRKALHKETAAQDALRHRGALRHLEIDQRRAYGLALVTCPRCGHSMFFDEVDGADVATIRCDRCKRPVW